MIESEFDVVFPADFSVSVLEDRPDRKQVVLGPCPQISRG